MIHGIQYIRRPPTSFPYRDLLVLEQMPLDVSDVVCEVGVGTGGTAVRLARLCQNVVGIDVSAPTIDRLDYLTTLQPNLRFLAADVTRPDDLGVLRGAFKRLVSCDTLEHVADPKGYCRGVLSLLAPGGELLVTFPNEPAQQMHGITRFESTESLLGLFEAAGAIGCRLGAATLTERAARVAERLGWRPLRAVRALLAPRARRAEASLPQTFDETFFFRRKRLWDTLSPAINAYWYLVLRRMVAAGPAFEIDWDYRKSDFGNSQVLVRAAKAE